MKEPSGSSSKKKPYYLEQTLAFVIQFTKSRHQSGNLDFQVESKP